MGLISKIYKELIQLSCKEKKQMFNLKTGTGSEKTFFQRSHTDGQQIHEKMLDVINHQGNANQNCNDISTHTSQNSYHQKDKKQQVLVSMWRKGNPYALWWECKLVQPLWKTVWRFLKILEIATYRIAKQQGPPVQHRELYSIS